MINNLRDAQKFKKPVLKHSNLQRTNRNKRNDDNKNNGTGYIETEGADLLDRDQIFEKLRNNNQQLRKKISKRKSVIFRLPKNHLDLDIHPNHSHPAVCKFRNLVNKQMQINRIQENNEVRLAMLSRVTFAGLSVKDKGIQKEKKFIKAIPGISYYSLIWYFFDPIIASIFTYDMFVFSFHLGLGEEYLVRDSLIMIFAGFAEIIANFVRQREDDVIVPTIKKIAVQYATSQLIFDILPILRVNLISETIWIKIILYIFVILRLKQVFRFGKTMGRAIQIIFSSISFKSDDVTQGRLAAKFISFFFFLFGMLHLLSMIIIIVGYDFVRDEYEEIDFSVYVYTLGTYYVINTITTCGYGDLTPKRPMHMLVTIFIQLLGLAFYGYSFQKILQLVQTAGAYQSFKQEHEDDFNHWLFSREKSTPCADKGDVMKKIEKANGFIGRNNIREYFMYRVFDQITFQQKVGISENFNVKFASQFPSFFKAVQINSIDQICWKIEPKLFMKGERLGGPDLKCKGIYFITGGTLSISLKGEPEIEIVNYREGDYFGEIYLLGKQFERDYVVKSEEVECFFVGFDELISSLQNQDLEVPKLRKMALFKQIAVQIEDSLVLESIEKLLEMVINQGAGLKQLDIHLQSIQRKREDEFFKLVRCLIDELYSFTSTKKNVANSCFKQLKAFFSSKLVEYTLEEYYKLRSELREKLKEMKIQQENEEMTELVKQKFDLINEPEPEIMTQPKMINLQFEEINEGSTNTLKGRHITKKNSRILNTEEFDEGLKNKIPPQQQPYIRQDTYERFISDSESDEYDFLGENLETLFDVNLETLHSEYGHLLERRPQPQNATVALTAKEKLKQKFSFKPYKPKIEKIEEEKSETSYSSKKTKKFDELFKKFLYNHLIVYSKEDKQLIDGEEGNDGENENEPHKRRDYLQHLESSDEDSVDFPTEIFYGNHKHDDDILAEKTYLRVILTNIITLGQDQYEQNQVFKDEPTFKIQDVRCSRRIKQTFSIYRKIRRSGV